MKRHILLTASLLVGLGVVGANAQETRPRTDPQQPEVYRPQEQPGQQHTRMGQTGGIVKGSELIGVSVKSNQNEEIGNIEDLVIASDGRIAVAILDVDGDKYGVPFKMLQQQSRPEQSGGMGQTGQTGMGQTGQAGGKAQIQKVENLMANVSKQQLQQAPKWEEDGSTSLDSFVSSVYSHFSSQLGQMGGGQSGMGQTGQTGETGRTGQTGQTGQTGMGQTAMGQQPRGPFVLASRVLDSSVNNQQDEDLGEIQDMAVSLANERVLYAVLDHGGVLGMGEKQFAVPWEALQARDQGAQITLNVTEQQLSQAEGFEDWPASPDTNLFRPASRGMPETGGQERR